MALPDAYRWTDPGFEHHAELPRFEAGGVRGTVLMGELAGALSPATAYTPLVGAELSITGAGEIPLREEFEYAAVTIDGDPMVDGGPLKRGSLLYLGCGRSSVAVGGAGRVFLMGGEPFAEQIVMWWNFIGRSHEEIATFREDWGAGRGFAEVRGFDGDPLPAPPLPGTPLKPRGRVR